MSSIRTGAVTSADGTVIVFDQSGEGPAAVLVQGALMGRADPVMSGIAAGLSRWFSVFSYDRRGRGDSGDTRPYAVQREAEDLAALIAEASPEDVAGMRGQPFWRAMEASTRTLGVSRHVLSGPPAAARAGASRAAGRRNRWRPTSAAPGREPAEPRP